MNWKNKFDRWDLEKGRKYFLDGKVEYLSKDNNVYTASVEGSLDNYYKVIIAINNKGDITSTKCTCPYHEVNKFCKHVAATMYEIEKTFPDFNMPDQGFKKAFKFTNDPNSFVDMEKITSHYNISEALYDKAIKEIDSHPNYRILDLSRMDNGEFFEFETTIFCEDRAYIDFTQDELTRCSCYCRKCMSNYSYYFDRKQKEDICLNRLECFILIDRFFKNNEVDYTNYAGKLLLDTLSSSKNETSLTNRAQTLKLIPVFNVDIYRKSSCTLKFKIGNTKFYNVKDLYEMVEEYKKGGIIQLSTKASIDFSKETFMDEYLPVFNLIDTTCVQIKDIYNSLNDRGIYQNYKKSSFGLSGYLLDKIFDLYYGKEIEYSYTNDSKPIKNTIKLGLMNNDGDIVIEPLFKEDVFNGINIKHKAIDCINGKDYKYCALENSFSRLICDNKAVDAINSSDYGDIKIGKSNLADFYYDYLPKLKSFPNLIIENEEVINEHIPIRPIFKFYLDVDDGVVVLRCKVLYKDKEYVLGDDLDKAERDSTRETFIKNLIGTYFIDYEGEYVIDNDDNLYEFLKSGIDDFKEYGEVYSTNAFDNLRSKKKVKMSIGVNIQSDLLNLNLMSNLSSRELLDVLTSYKLKKKYHRLSTGEFVDMEDKDLNRLLSLKEQLNISDKKLLKGDINVPSYRALALDDELKEFSDVDVDRTSNFKEFVDKFEHIDESDYKLPKELNATLRSYQIHGFKWLNVLFDCGFGGILADEMGLGKTLQTISLIEYRKEIKNKIHTLIITPASLVYNWYAEFNKFAPNLEVAMVVGNKSERSGIIINHRDFDVLITSYDLLKRDIETYENIKFDLEVIDEAQYIKNQNTGAAKCVKQINATRRFALTGTPIENRLSELWSIFDYLMPDYLYKYDYFRKNFEVPIVNGEDQEVSNILKRMIGPFILRRRKADVLKDLPDKIEKVYYANFDSKQKSVYDAQISKISKLVEDGDIKEFTRNKIAILAELTKTRQICCDPSLILEEYDGTSAKKDTCLELIEESIDGGHKLLLFSQFTSMLEILEKELEERNIAYYKITGATDKRERLELCNKFNNDDVKVFLISLKAGGTGLNLIGADIVIHYDPWWNEAVISQATDRTHRIGQKRTVTVYKLIAKGTIEEKILKLQEDKKNLADEILSGANTSLTSMSKDELLDLLKGE